jgi:hypothetical protein
MDFLIALILILTGLAVMYYRYQIYDLTGEWTWAATYLGGNGTITAIVLIGMALIAWGVAFPFWLGDDIKNPPKLRIESQTSQANQLAK